MDYAPDVPVVDPSAASDLHPLAVFEALRTAAQNPTVAPSMPSVPSAPAVPAEHGGWRAILQMMAPVVGGLAMGGGPKQTGFLNGYNEGQQAVQEDKAKKEADSQKRAQIVSGYVQDIAQKADQIADPATFDHFVSVADMTAAKAGFTKPGEIKSQLVFNSNNLAKKQLKELTDQIDGFNKAGYSLDDLASSGATLQLSDGTHVPIKTAMDITRARPVNATGQPIAKPDKTAGTAEERYLQKWAKEQGLKVEDLTAGQELDARKAYAGAGRSDTPPAGSDFNQFLKRWAKDNGKTPEQVTSADEMKARKLFNDSTKDPQLNEINLSLKQLQLENERNKAKAATAGGYEVKAGSRDERIAQQLSTGDLTFSDFNRLLGARSAATIDRKLALYDKAMELNPDFTPAKFELGYKFASNQGTQMATVALNRVEPNIDKLIALSDKWDRTKYPTINSFLRAVGAQWGDQRITDFGQLQTIVGDELGPALGVGQASDLKTRLGLEMAGGNKGADNFRSGMMLVKDALNNQRKALNTQKGQYGDKTPEPQASAPLKVGGFTVVVK